MAEYMDICFESDDTGGLRALLEGEDVTLEMRTENTGERASKIAGHSEVRAALLKRQRLFAKGDGLVADGRDMGTVIFPTAHLKIYMTASIEERASRRYKELLARARRLTSSPLAKGEDVSLRALAEQVRARDERDMNRDVSPLVPAEDAIELDTSNLSIKEVLETILGILDFKRF